jgi:hypothetical protein
MENDQSAQPTTETYMAKLVEKLTVAVVNLREQCDRLALELDEQRDFIRSMRENTHDVDRMLTLREAAKIAGVSYETMIAWANWKEIEAIDVARKKGGKPRWRIAPSELQRFLKSRARFRYEPPPRRRRPSRTDRAAKFYP